MCDWCLHVTDGIGPFKGQCRLRYIVRACKCVFEYYASVNIDKLTVQRPVSLAGYSQCVSMLIVHSVQRPVSLALYGLDACACLLALHNLGGCKSNIFILIVAHML